MGTVRKNGHLPDRVRDVRWAEAERREESWWGVRRLGIWTYPSLWRDAKSGDVGCGLVVDADDVEDVED